MSRPCPDEAAKRKQWGGGGWPLLPKVSSDDSSLIPGMTLIERGVRLILRGRGILFRRDLNLEVGNPVLQCSKCQCKVRWIRKIFCFVLNKQEKQKLSGQESCLCKGIEESKLQTLQKPQIHRNSSKHLHLECGNTEPNKGIWIFSDKQEKKKAHPHNQISIRPIPFCGSRLMNIHMNYNNFESYELYIDSSNIEGLDLNSEIEISSK
ncbi:hypothetical protein CDAR_301811 [Caerostris darwini]|uniref:Uncharacterized protein n=1 Tax=Caerostris darwini TaxID=1538125 RepID=A0AAV4VF99_9ARAC|nr:hypothetical protein CDAR_301811 [Caerostris darwini]